jgi:hybrid cluster-associated redox disulfide protein
MWSFSAFEEPLSLSAIMDRWPATIAVFLHYRFICVGCVIAPYHTLIDACAEHGANPEDVISALEAAIRQSAQSHKPSGATQDN